MATAAEPSFAGCEDAKIQKLASTFKLKLKPRPGQPRGDSKSSGGGLTAGEASGLSTHVGFKVAAELGNGVEVINANMIRDQYHSGICTRGEIYSTRYETDMFGEL